MPGVSGALMPDHVLAVVPPTAWDADKACPGLYRALDSWTSLIRGRAGRIEMRFGRGGARQKIVEYYPDGAVRVFPSDIYGHGGLNRIAAALPMDWTVQFRPRMRPRFVFRDVYTVGLSSITFLASGDVRFGSGYGNALSWVDLNHEADEREGVHVLPSRRRVPRPLPPYAVRAMEAPRNPALDEELVEQVRRTLRPRANRPTIQWQPEFVDPAPVPPNHEHRLSPCGCDTPHCECGEPVDLTDVERAEWRAAREANRIPQPTYQSVATVDLSPAGPPSGAEFMREYLRSLDRQVYTLGVDRPAPLDLEA